MIVQPRGLLFTSGMILRSCCALCTITVLTAAMHAELPIIANDSPLILAKLQDCRHIAVD